MQQILWFHSQTENQETIAECGGTEVLIEILQEMDKTEVKK